jgi:hypothetical protein
VVAADGNDQRSVADRVGDHCAADLEDLSDQFGGDQLGGVPVARMRPAFMAIMWWA